MDPEVETQETEQPEQKEPLDVVAIMYPDTQKEDQPEQKQEEQPEQQQEEQQAAEELTETVITESSEENQTEDDKAAEEEETTQGLGNWNVAIAIDFATLIITVPQADLTLVSGSLYELPTEDTFRADVNALMDDET